MKSNSISGMSRVLAAAVLIASVALAGCASVSDESFAHAGNNAVPTDRMEGA